MKKVIVIGAGIAGLTCGIYSRINGFDVEIYEMHTITGGECTGWDRGDYHFDGCLHWLVGSKPGTSLNRLWWDTGALDGTVNLIHSEIYARYEEEGACVNFYTDVRKLQDHLVSLFPEDRREIRALCGAIKRLGDFSMPLDKPQDLMTAADGLKFAIGNASKLPILQKYGAMTMLELANRFQSPLLRRALLATFPGHYTAIAFVSTLGGMNAGDCGFPAGGSRALAGRMEAKFLSLGGKVFYRSKVEKILVENGAAVGIRLADGREARSDFVVSCADGYDTFKRLLEDRYTPEMYQNLFSHPKEYPTVTSAQVFVGVNAKIPFDCRGVEVHRKEPLQLGGVAINDSLILHYGFDPSMAPEGKTVLSCYYPADYDYWNDLHDRDRYRAEKKRLEQDAVASIVARYPEAEGHIEATDVVTPKTYERYCNAWRGSWMTWIKSGNGVPRYFPGLLAGLDRFLLAGMWTQPPGGLPGAGAAGRFAAQRLCLLNGLKFKTE